MVHAAQLARLVPRRSRGHRPAAVEAAVLIRPASLADEAEIARLSALDERPALPGDEHLVAELDGRVVAALDIAGGDAVADPFVPTRAIVELLGLRAAQMR